MINWVPNKYINTDKVEKLLQKCNNTNHYTNYGPNVQSLEKKIHTLLQLLPTKKVIVTCNATLALHSLVLSISRVNKKQLTWSTQAFTFPPSAQGVLRDVEIKDIDEEGGLSLSDISTDGAIVTNIFGNVVDIDKYTVWAKVNNKFLIFDNAATPLTYYKNVNCNNYGVGSIISFHHTKPIGFGEGGAIIVDEKYEKMARCIINFGIGGTEKYWMEEASNCKMSDISAVYILQHLDTVNTIIETHKTLYNYMKEKLKDHHSISLYPNFGDNTVLSCFCLLFEQYDDSLRIKLNSKGIFCRKYYTPLKSLPITEKYYNRILCIPCTVDMKISDIDLIISYITE